MSLNKDGLNSAANSPLRKGIGVTMNRKRNTRAQNLIEYAIVVALVTAAVSAMSTYVFRSVQATQKAIDTEASQ